jgi:hypothetical protein
LRPAVPVLPVPCFDLPDDFLGMATNLAVHGRLRDSRSSPVVHPDR